MEQPAARNVAHEARRRSRDARPLDAGPDIIEDGRGIPAAIREFRIERLAEDLRRGPQAWRGFDLVEKGESVVERQPAERTASIRVGLQRASRLAKPSDFRPKLIDHAINRAASTA